MSSHSCVDFSEFRTYDPWIVSHQLLPSIAVVIGIDWREVIILMYVWETIEAIMSCVDDVFRDAIAETSSSSLISDPLQGFLGILVAKVLMNVYNMDKPIFNDWVAYIWTMLFILPIIPITIDPNRDIVWMFIPSWMFCLFLLIYIPNRVTCKMGIWLALYALSVTISVFALKGTFNSFYTASSAAIVIILVAITFRNIQ
jgi:hypothetical protein